MRQTTLLSFVKKRPAHGGDGGGTIEPATAAMSRIASESSFCNASAPRHPTVQLQLDVGQSSVAVAAHECPRCGMVTSGSTTDEELHARSCKRLAAARLKREQEAFIADVFGEAESRLHRGDKGAARQDGARLRKRAGEQASHSSSLLGIIEHYIQRHDPCTTDGSQIVLKRAATPTTARNTTIPPPHIEPSGRVTLAILNLSGAHRWASRAPQLVEALVRGDAGAGFGPLLRSIGDSLKLRARDAMSHEAYDVADESAAPIWAVLVLSTANGGCLASVAGRHISRMHQSSQVASTTEPTIEPPCTTVWSKPVTQCDVMHAFVASKANSGAACSQGPARGSGNALHGAVKRCRDEPHASVSSRDAFLFGNLVANRPGLFSASNGRNSDSTRLDCSEEAQEDVVLRMALDALGQHVVYGCVFNAVKDMSYEEELLEAVPALRRMHQSDPLYSHEALPSLDPDDLRSDATDEDDVNSSSGDDMDVDSD